VPPFLSVVMPTYNGERYINAALESVRGAKDEGIELVIVDDGSSDRTLEIIHDYAKLLPIRMITSGRTGNWVAATNLGLREATGDWACFLHQDDFWLPGRIGRLRNEMESTEGALILHNAIFVGHDGQALGPWNCPLPAGRVPSSQFIERLLVQNFIAILRPSSGAPLRLILVDWTRISGFQPTGIYGSGWEPLARYGSSPKH